MEADEIDPPAVAVMRVELGRVLVRQRPELEKFSRPGACAEGAKRIIVCGLTLQAISVRLYVFSHSLASFYGLALMFGFSYGAVMPLYALLVREYFGARIMGTMFGAVNMAATLGMALGPWAGGWLYDAYSSYFWLYVGSFGIGLGAAAIALSFRPPREIECF